MPHAAITRSRCEPATIAPLVRPPGSVTSIQPESDSGGLLDLMAETPRVTVQFDSQVG
jgi:hypothetical protein